MNEPAIKPDVRVIAGSSRGAGERRRCKRLLAALLCCLWLSACAPSEHELAELGQRGSIQVDAPVKAASTLTIDAPTIRVWRILTDVAAWPRWLPGVERVSSTGTLAEGAVFAWKTDGTTIRSRVVLFAPPYRLAWIGQADMAHAVHVFVLTPLGPHATRIESRESMDGPLLGWFYDSAALQASENELLQNLKRAAEASDRSAGGPKRTTASRPLPR